MAKDTHWFSHDYNSRSDGKILKLRMKHGMEGVGIYWCIVEMLYEENGFIELDYERITFELRTNEEIVKSVIHDFSLFEVNKEKFWSNTAVERLSIRKDKSDKAKESINKRWEEERKRKLLVTNNKNTNVLQSNNEGNTIKDSIVKNNIVNNTTEGEKKIEIKSEIEKPFNWGIEVNKFLNDSRWRESFCMQKGLKDKDLFKCMKEFTTKLTLQEDFKDCGGLKRHFVNHYNKYGLVVSQLEVKEKPKEPAINLK